MPGLFPVAADAYEADHPDYESAVVVDSARQRWIVRTPRHHEASVRLETEHVILHAFTPGLRARLPFQLPTVVGSAEQEGLRTFVYPQVRGEVVELDELVRRSRVVSPDREPLAAQIGQVLATVHMLPTDLVQQEDLPSYTPEQTRRRLLAEVDRAAGTGRVPSTLLRRWESWLEDQQLWAFEPTVVHGDLSEDSLIVDGARVAEVRGWHDIHVGDPAADFAWLMSCPDQHFTDQVLEVYTVRLSDAPDAALLRRAYLYAEFALARWLVRAQEQEDHQALREATEMLLELERDLRNSGAFEDEGSSTDR